LGAWFERLALVASPGFLADVVYCVGKRIQVLVHEKVTAQILLCFLSLSLRMAVGIGANLVG